MQDQIIANIGNIALFFGIVLATFFVAYLVNRFFTRLIRRSTQFMQNDPTNYQFLKHFISGIIYLVGFSLAIYMMPGLRAVASSLLAGAGILAVAVGFASQHALSNVISGIFIVIFKPFRINDRLNINTLVGVVEDITLRHTVIRDFENRRIIIPNANISNEVIINSNINDDKICRLIDIGISYESNLPLAKKIIREEIEKHPLILDNRTPENIAEGQDVVLVRVTALGEFSVNIRAWAWAAQAADGFILYCDVLERIKLRFDEENIEIPYPHRTIVHKNPNDGKE